MKKIVVAAATAAVVVAGAGTSEARCGVRFGFFPFFASAVVLSTPVVRYNPPPPPPRYTERVVVQRDDDGCKKIVKKIYDEDGDLVDRKVIRDCRDREWDDD